MTNTKESVWTYRIGHNRIVPRRVIKAQPGYSAALVETQQEAEFSTTAGYDSRMLSEEDMAPLNDDKITLYRKEIMSIAWLVVRTRPNIAAAVAHKQTNCSRFR